MTTRLDIDESIFSDAMLLSIANRFAAKEGEPAFLARSRRTEAASFSILLANGLSQRAGADEDSDLVHGGELPRGLLDLRFDPWLIAYAGDKHFARNPNRRNAIANGHALQLKITSLPEIL